MKVAIGLLNIICSIVILGVIIYLVYLNYKLQNDVDMKAKNIKFYDLTNRWANMVIIQPNKLPSLF